MNLEAAWALTPGELALLDAGRRVLDAQEYERELALAWWGATLAMVATSGKRLPSLGDFLGKASPGRAAETRRKAEKLAQAEANKKQFAAAFTASLVEMEERRERAARRRAGTADREDPAG